MKRSMIKVHLSFLLFSIYSLGCLGYAPSVLPPESVVLKEFRPRTNPFVREGLDIGFTDYDELFSKIQEVSPLAKNVIERRANGLGLQGIDKNADKLTWRTIESNTRGVVHEIQRLEKYNGILTPLLRFRASLEGPCLGGMFGQYIVDLEQRRKYDAQIANVNELHLGDIDSANIAMGFGKYGDCSRLGVGYAQTKSGVVSPREQLYLYGLQEFSDGSSIIWGTEMDEKHNHLFPAGQRHTRAKSHLFAATLSPTGEDSFDVEYVIQMDIGGNIPQFLTNPVMISTVKSLFDVAAKEFRQEKSVQAYLAKHHKEESFATGLLMTP